MRTSWKPARHEGLVSQALQALVSKVPRSAEPAEFDPPIRAQALAKSAALRAAALSGTMSLPPGPLGLMTVLPDLLSVWRLQQQLVADIAAAFGKSALLTPEVMTICLFRHGSGPLTADLLVRSGHRVLIRRIARSTLHQLLGKISIRVSQRLAAKGFSRWLPLIGALAVGAYAYYETSQVAANAIELFSSELVLEHAGSETMILDSPEQPQSALPIRKPRAKGTSRPRARAAKKTQRRASRRRVSPALD